jgi:hypothetical protein
LRVLGAYRDSEVQLAFGPEDRWLAALRRLPLIGLLAPAPQERVWDEPADYWVQVGAVRRGGRLSYEVVLLDSVTPV